MMLGVTSPSCLRQLVEAALLLLVSRQSKITVAAPPKVTSLIA